MAAGDKPPRKRSYTLVIVRMHNIKLAGVLHQLSPQARSERVSVIADTDAASKDFNSVGSRPCSGGLKMLRKNGNLVTKAY